MEKAEIVCILLIILFPLCVVTIAFLITKTKESREMNRRLTTFVNEAIERISQHCQINEEMRPIQHERERVQQRIQNERYRTELEATRRSPVVPARVGPPDTYSIISREYLERLPLPNLVPPGPFSYNLDNWEAVRTPWEAVSVPPAKSNPEKIKEEPVPRRIKNKKAPRPYTKHILIIDP